MCDGVESVVPLSALPSPQSMSNLFALPDDVIVRVTASGDPPETTSPVKSTSVTAVFLMTLKITSLRSSIPSTILVDDVNVLRAPDVIKLLSVGVPRVMDPPTPANLVAVMIPDVLILPCVPIPLDGRSVRLAPLMAGKAPVN